MRNRYIVPTVCRQCAVMFLARTDQRGGYCGRTCSKLAQAVHAAARALSESDTRLCMTCGVTKPLAEFSRDRKGRNGLSTRCKTCANANTARWQRENQARAAQKKAAYYRAHRGHLMAIEAKRARAWKLANPEKARLVARANDAIYQAVKRGKLMRPATCEACDREGKIEAAHHDYSRPLDVKWLCHSCHVRWDHAVPKIR